MQGNDFYAQHQTLLPYKHLIALSIVKDIMNALNLLQALALND
jgi:hypothetical protein